MNQIIENTKAIKFLDDAIQQAKWVMKKDKAQALQRARDVIYGYYETLDGYVSATKPEPDLGDLAGEDDIFG